jgi:hypothetical protein
MDMRKGQVTLFVVLGLALLIVVGLVLLLPTQRQPSTLIAQQESDTVTALVQQCLAQAAEESITTVGLQGGYATMQGLRITQNQDTQIVGIAPQQIPYWHEISRCANGYCASDNRPSLCSGRSCPVQETPKPVSFQSSIELVARDRLLTCLNNFTSIPSTIVEPKSQPKVTATIREEDVALSLSYPLALTVSDASKVDLEKFSATVPVALPRTYRMARQLQQLERDTSYLENAYLHMLTVYTGLDTPFPPMRELQLTGAERTWMRSQVQQDMEAQLLPFMNFMQVANAEESYVPLQVPGINETLAPYAEGYLSYFTIELNDSSYPLGVDYEYLPANTYLSINERELLRPRSLPNVGGLLSFMGLSMRDYRFRYNVAFPMVVRVTDPAAFAGKGFELDFGLETNIRNNQPLNASSLPTAVAFSTANIDLSSAEQRTNHTYTFHVKDRRTGRALEGASILLGCGSEFDLGTTDAQGVWIGKLPYCLGGAVVAQAPGYLRASIDVSSTEDDGKSSSLPDLMLWPLAEKKITVYKLTLNDPNAAPVRNVLGQNDSVTLRMQRIKESDFEADTPLATTLQFGQGQLNMSLEDNYQDIANEIKTALSGEQITQEEYDEILQTVQTAEVPLAIGGSQSQVVELAPGRYELDGTLMYAGNISIPPRTVRIFLFITRTIEGRNLPTWQTGGIDLTGANTVTFTPEQIYDAKNLSVFVLEQPLPKTWEDIEKFQDVNALQSYGRVNYAMPKWE